jgi:hypothetical protein
MPNPRRTAAPSRAHQAPHPRFRDSGAVRGRGRHLANRMANSASVADTVANSVANVASEPKPVKRDRRDYMRESVRKKRAKG